MKRLRISNLGPIHEADVTFGDLTVLIGPQASGKSLFAQTYKAVSDAKAIRRDLKNYGFDWANGSGVQDFCEAYYGGGLRDIVSPKTQLFKDDATQPLSFENIAHPRGKAPSEESVFLIPAQRVLVLQDGWPRPFMSYPVGDPYSIKHFSETVRLLMERGLDKAKTIFPQTRRLKTDLREMLSESIYMGSSLNVKTEGPRKQIVLQQGASSAPLSIGAWSAGQREFTPLLLGLYWLMPAQWHSKPKEVETVIIEEPEMGLHPQAIVSFGLLVFELLFRGYRVIVSTHSPVVVDLVWAAKELGRVQDSVAQTALKQIFRLPKLGAPLKEVFKSALKKSTYRVYYFDRTKAGVVTRDISTLDPGSTDPNVSGWGGLSGYSGDIADAVGKALA